MYELINWIFDHINKRSPILIQTPNYRSFGNGAEEIFYGLLKAKREKKKILFLYPRPVSFGKFGIRVVNRELFCLRSDDSLSNENVYGFLGGYLLSLYTFFLRLLHILRSSRRLRKAVCLVCPGIAVSTALDYGYIVSQIGKSTLWKPHGAKSFSWDVVEEQNWRQQYVDFTPPAMKEDKRRKAEQVRVQMGIPLTDWFVCLHVPEYPFCAGRDRSASIHNYIEAINTITAAGGWVIRLGDPSMQPLPPMERVIDYARTRYKSALLDIYWLSECRFFIGLNSGPSAVAALFGRPMVLVNLTEWTLSFPIKKGDLAIIRHVFSHSHKRFLSIQEILEEPFTVQLLNRCPSEAYYMVENSSEEIREVVEEFMSRPEPYAYSDLQEAFNEGRNRQIRRSLDQGEPHGWDGVPERDILVHQYRIAALVEATAGTLGQKFLERNWFVDELEASELYGSTSQ
jgi:putative glycosyltransferase (TIGR04372 family)